MALEDAISQTKNMINTAVLERKIDSNLKFNGYQKVYFYTNENIKGYLDLLNFQAKSKALTVLSGGDQAFSLISKGIRDIHTFDINLLTEYLALGLKRAMILKYDYAKYLEVLNCFYDGCSIDDLTSIIMDLSLLMDFRYRQFWQEIANYNYQLQNNIKYYSPLNLMDILSCGAFDYSTITKRVNYLESYDAYELVRERIANVNITFQVSNILDVATNFDNNQYDFILMSNILDYLDTYYGSGWDKAKLLELEEELMSIASNEAVILLNYLFAFKKINGKTRAFRGSGITIKDLTDEEVKIYLDPISLEKSFTKVYDGIILKRVKK